MISLTSRSLSDLSILEEISEPEKVRSLNLWGNRIVDIQELAAFRGLKELVLRENIITSI